MTKIILMVVTAVILISTGLYFLLRKKDTDVPKKCSPITNCKNVNKNNCLVCDECEQPYYGETCQTSCQPNQTWNSSMKKCVDNKHPFIEHCISYDGEKCGTCEQPYYGDKCQNYCQPNQNWNPSLQQCTDKIANCVVYDQNDSTICDKCKQPFHGPLCTEKCDDKNKQQWNGMTGKCECIDGYTGYPECVIIPPKPDPSKICEGRGIKDSSGKCICNNCPDPARSDRQPSCAGDNCQYTDKDTCNGKGEVQPDGTCNCSTYFSNTEKKNKTYIGKHCSYDDNTTCNGTGVVSVDSNDNATCTSCICSSINQCSYNCKVEYQKCISPSCFYNPVTKHRMLPDQNCIRNCQGLLNNCMNSISCQT